MRFLMARMAVLEWVSGVEKRKVLKSVTMASWIVKLQPSDAPSIDDLPKL